MVNTRRRTLDLTTTFAALADPTRRAIRAPGLGRDLGHEPGGSLRERASRLPQHLALERAGPIRGRQAVAAPPARGGALMTFPTWWKLADSGKRASIA
jgi:hypothetical protein